MITVDRSKKVSDTEKTRTMVSVSVDIEKNAPAPEEDIDKMSAIGVVDDSTTPIHTAAIPTLVDIYIHFNESVT